MRARAFRLLLLSAACAGLLAGGASEPARATSSLSSPPPAVHASPIPLAREPLVIEEPLSVAQVGAAVELIGADRWRAAGFTGFGVRVAIVDTGFARYEELLGAGLPGQVHVRSFRADGDIAAGSEHGTLAARIVSAIAPNAELHLLNFSTALELSALVDYLLEQRIQVVSFSIGFVHNGPGNGTGPVNDVVTRGTSAGALWAVASGNWAQQHWGGVFSDRNGNSIHEFTGGVEENGRAYRAGDLILVSLRWDDPWGESCNDYDIELFGPDGGLVRAARGLQNCTSNPVEGLQVLATRDGRYRARVVRAGAAPRRLDLLMLGSPDRSEALDFAVVAGSLAEPADNPHVLTVGATNPLLPQQLARFSSRGPTTDGRAKPELVAPTGPMGGADGAFSGTSAATPHVAAAAALLLEAFPQAEARALMTQLRERAMRLPPPAIESEVGAGSLHLGSLAGLGPLLPAGARNAALTAITPEGAPYAVFRYSGPGPYPARFTYMLTGGRVPRAVYRLDLARLRFETFVPGAPRIVNTFEAFREGDLLLVTFAP